MEAFNARLRSWKSFLELKGRCYVGVGCLGRDSCRWGHMLPALSQAASSWEGGREEALH